MEINRNNYEAYFIDYLEGNLDERLVDSFIAFIQSNPDLRAELNLFETVSATPENISFSKKNTLYKERYDSEKEFDNAAIAILEEDISEEEKFEFEKYLAEHPEKKKDAGLFSQTKLQADESIIFSNKNKLYRKPLGKTLLLWSTRVAAVFVLALAIFILFDKPSNEIITENKVAEVNNERTQNETTPELQTTPVEEKNSVTVKEEKLIAKQAFVKANPKKEIIEPIRENTIKNVEDEYIALARIPLEVPSEMSAITASLNVGEPNAKLGTMYLYYPDNEFDEELLIGDKVKEKFNLGKITKAGLNLVASISNERFTYETGNDGKVIEYNYDSRLFAFSVPTKRTQPE